MKERGIIFNSEMVNAILDGRKTQTRRVIKPQPESFNGWVNGDWCGWPIAEGGGYIKCPYGEVGDILFGMENYEFLGDDISPRRIFCMTIEITGIRVERLREISDEDCWAEGIDEDDYNKVEHFLLGGSCIEEGSAERQVFSALWDSIYNGTEKEWDNNPWVWVIEFKRVEK